MTPTFKALLEIVGILAGVAGLIFTAGGVYANYHYMRAHMVTQKDMRLAVGDAMMKFAESVNQHYVTRRECALMHATKPTNGHSREEANR